MVGFSPPADIRILAQNVSSNLANYWCSVQRFGKNISFVKRMLLSAMLLSAIIFLIDLEIYMLADS